MQVREVKTEDQLREMVGSYDYQGWLRMSDDLYFGSTDILSRSTLVKHLKCPAQLKVPDTGTKEALIEGPAFHNRLLEAEIFDENFAIAPKVDRRTKAGKAEYKEFQETLNGRDCISQETLDKIDTMIEQVRYDPDISDLLYSGDKYYELACMAELNGILCKCKIDVWEDSSRSVFEFKTTIADSPENFVHSFFRYNYDIQCAFYFDIVMASTEIPIHEYHIIGVQKEPPHQVYKFTAGESVFQLGRARYQKLLAKHRECIDQDYFPSAMPAFEFLEAPGYLLNKHL